MMWIVVLGVLVAATAGTAIAWENFRSKLEAANAGRVRDEPIQLPGEQPKDNRRSREVVLEQPVDAGTLVLLDDEELTPLGKRVKKKPPVPVNLPPGEKAWRSMRADFLRLEQTNEGVAKKYRIRVMSLESKKSDEPSFLKDVAKLQDQLKTELARPENR